MLQKQLLARKTKPKQLALTPILLLNVEPELTMHLKQVQLVSNHGKMTGTYDVYQGVDETKLIPLLTKALQEALNRIEALESNEVADDATDSALLTLVANLVYSCHCP